mmetsp:Transcript_26053/g.18510  ORF Transcript_26053/g.18510 Transcript_26053/m.18510 type:complete len:90 (+) Transcript_26053:571-840(+)
MDKHVLLWDVDSGEKLGKPLKGHTQFVTSMSWEPMISQTDDRRLATSSKDKTVRIWSTKSFQQMLSLGSHTASVTKVLWGGEGLLYSAS